MSETHVPVFLEAVLNSFRESRTVREGKVRAAFDGTFGRGGHTAAILSTFLSPLTVTANDAKAEMPRMVAFDWDEAAIRFGQEKFATEIAAGRLNLVRASYLEFKSTIVARADLPKNYDLMLLDLGVSSPQLDEAARGFSFYHDGPLDMRMDQRGELTAANIVNTWDEQDLARLFIEYGEIQRPYRVVRAIVADRKAKKPFETTKELASMIERVDGWHKKGSHPATKYFLALRLKVNE
jgi:16S rRNA (cytosine1402-N4)-methyltransferase